MSIRPKHLQFCLYYLQTNEPAVAYSMAYPKASTKSLYAAASRLLARPDVTAWINETRYRMQERLLQEIEEKEVTQKKEALLSINQKRAVLTRIINGETRRTRHIKTKYGCTKVQDDLPIYAVLRAIDMDTRLENFQNYLLHRDSWGKSPSLYINTPTLQQQVNILIAQTQAETPDSPVIATQEAISRNTALHTIQPPNSTPHVIAGCPAESRSPDHLSHEMPHKAPLLFSGEPVPPRREDIAEKPSALQAIGEVPPAPDKKPPVIATQEATSRNTMLPAMQPPNSTPAYNNCIPLLAKEGRMAVPSLTEKSHSGEVPPAPDRNSPPREGVGVGHLAPMKTPLLNKEGVGGGKSLSKRPINRLTNLNKTPATRTKTPRYIYNKGVTSPRPHPAKHPQKE